MELQIVGSKVFLTEYGTVHVHVLDLKTGSWIRKFAVPAGSAHGLFVKGNRVLVTNVNKETVFHSMATCLDYNILQNLLE